VDQDVRARGMQAARDRRADAARAAGDQRRLSAQRFVLQLIPPL